MAQSNIAESAGHFTVCTPPDTPPLADHLARDKEHFYQNDEMIEETQWLEQLCKMT